MLLIHIVLPISTFFLIIPYVEWKEYTNIPSPILQIIQNGWTLDFYIIYYRTFVRISKISFFNEYPLCKIKDTLSLGCPNRTWKMSWGIKPCTSQPAGCCTRQPCLMGRLGEEVIFTPLPVYTITL
nr:MAG TPA: hypothetical protein [Caudoviricetes sp.]